jgi:hypothetical protein
MGLGADLLWTPVLRALQARNGKRVLIYDRPRLSDILAGVPYDRASTRRRSPIFENNPFVEFPICSEKGMISRLLDRFGEGLIGFNRLKGWLEDFFYTREKRSDFEFLYFDLPEHSYVERVEKGRYVWKKGGHIIDILSTSVGLQPVAHECELFFNGNDDAIAQRLIASLGADHYITIEPDTNTDFFGELRGWPFERWQEVIHWAKKAYPLLPVVQLGMPGSRPLDGCLNMCGKTSFRQAAQLIRHARLFLGTEGGLMHCAKAVHTPALVLWGGLTDPGFAAYPDKHTLIHHPVPCSPCGLLGNCPNNHLCMLSITPVEVISALGGLLDQLVPALRRS